MIAKILIAILCGACVGAGGAVLSSCLPLSLAGKWFLVGLLIAAYLTGVFSGYWSKGIMKNERSNKQYDLS